MSLTPWRLPLARALHRNRSQPHSHYLQLATITHEGLPANRTVVFRGFWSDTDWLQFVTDSRSEKIIHIQHQPLAEACWYFTKTREQFRLAGELILITAACEDKPLQLARQAAWEKLSDSARLQFAWPSPGKPREKEKEAFTPTQPSESEPLDNFCLLLLNTKKVDWLELRGEPQNRTLYLLKGEKTWSTQLVNP
ncbi:pyridoxamine 5'-phosphate oxidase family protein [Pleurocapsales cyanobacterium LEGE 06147]|nr:pyridoxamine 5'-phosphate oxidase family protein [Pleurocapsales cyanobacterium LEGE 06147]